MKLVIMAFVMAIHVFATKDSDLIKMVNSVYRFVIHRVEKEIAHHQINVRVTKDMN